MSYSARKIRNYIEDPQHHLPYNASIAQQFFLAEDDHEERELRQLLALRRVPIAVTSGAVPAGPTGGSKTASSSSAPSSGGWGSWLLSRSAQQPNNNNKKKGDAAAGYLIKDCHVVNMHGAVRGVDAAMALLRNERETFKLYWTSLPEPLTANT